MQSLWKYFHKQLIASHRTIKPLDLALLEVLVTQDNKRSQGRFQLSQLPAHEGRGRKETVISIKPAADPASQAVRRSLNASDSLPVRVSDRD